KGATLGLTATERQTLLPLPVFGSGCGLRLDHCLGINTIGDAFNRDFYRRNEKTEWTMQKAPRPKRLGTVYLARCADELYRHLKSQFLQSPRSNLILFQ